MEEYREKNMPAATSATEHQDPVMDAWQIIVANFDREISDGKETFGRKTSQQSVEEEYSIYVMGALSAGSTVDTLGFWKVSFLQILHNIYSHKLSTDARAYFPDDLSHRHGLLAYTGVRCPLREGFLIQRGDGHEKEEQDKPGVDGGPPSS
jgi:hypothetical protein